MGCQGGCRCEHKALEGKEKIQVDLSTGSNWEAQGAGKKEIDLLRTLPKEVALEVPRDRFDRIIQEVSTWGPLTVTVRNESTILEVKTPFPVGEYGQGYYNLQGGDTPMGGHIKVGNLSSIFFVSRPFMGLESHSIQFFDQHGNPMFKIFLGRDSNRRIRPDQLERFVALKQRLSNE